MIQCSIATTPKLIVSGITPYPGNNHIFLDDSINNGLGFMLQPDDGSEKTPSLSEFYSDGLSGKAITNNTPVNVNSAAVNTPLQQIIWVGLVGMKDSQDIVPGPFSASLIVTGLIP